MDLPHTASRCSLLQRSSDFTTLSQKGMAAKTFISVALLVRVPGGDHMTERRSGVLQTVPPQFAAAKSALSIG